MTDVEIRQDFKDHITAFAQMAGWSEHGLLQDLKDWYDGFCFVAGQPNVYNPFSTLQLFYHRRFANYWFESGSPTFLIKLIKTQGYDIQALDQFETDALAFSTYDIEDLAIVPLLFQTGYLSIKAYRQDEDGEIYTLSYPNYEVKNAFLTYFLKAYSSVALEVTGSHLHHLAQALRQKNFVRFFEILNIFFANIPYDIQLQREKYYQTIFHLIFVLLGLRIDAEVRTNQGRINAVVELNQAIFLFEFKLDSRIKTALKQIKDNDYYQKYRLKNKTITLVGVNFDSKKGQVTEWETEPGQP